MKRFKTVLVALMVVGCLVLPVQAQQQAPPPAINGARGIPDDWSHHRLIFSEASSPRILGELQQEPRYRLQQLSRNRLRLASAAEILDAKALQVVHSWGRPIKSNKRVLKGDWSENLGSGAKVGAGMYPAKYSFSISSASCSDFVVFNTGLPGTSSQASFA